jgi:hypothetical protein
VVLQAALQQFPIPLVPQTPEKQESFSVQAPPPSNWPTHALLEHQNPVAQSVAMVQLVLHVMASAQPKLPGQRPGVPGVQVPLPLQRLEVRVPLVQLGVPHAMVLGG